MMSRPERVAELAHAEVLKIGTEDVDAVRRNASKWHLRIMVFFLEVAAVVFLIMLLCLFRAGRELGVGYAIGHIVLTVVLVPLALLGLFIVPRMVDRDLFRVARGNCG